MTINIITGAAERILPTIPAESVHMGCTSPPYDKLRLYSGFQWNFEEIARELYRVLVPGGVLCWNVKDQVIDGSESLTSCRQKLFFRELGFRAHQTIIYEKNNFAHPSSNRYHDTFEYVFVLSKGAPRAFNAIKDRPNKSAGEPGCYGANTVTQADGSKRIRPKKIIAAVGMRTAVWKGNTRGQEQWGKKLPQPGMMPKWLARDLIISWSNPGDVVIDPFCGSGTTCQEALKLGRDAIGIELKLAHATYAREETARQAGAALLAATEATAA